MPEQRPDPDQLLEKLQRDDARAARGHFKLFFGACAGVGKTYAMLSAARLLRTQGVDVIIGVVETHGRQDTIALTEGFEILPPQLVSHRDREREEFDLDGALRRKPALILIDELAHSNLPGTRHQKRWQDVEELLAAGIDVYSTVNVQHIESLNDVVGQITGIRVWETIPDRVLDMADEITLVDLPPDELLRRLKDGKVYIPHQAERAAKNFFRKGNLIALRELALRRTADQVDAQMRDYRADQAIQDVWQAKERLLVCVGPHESSNKLVRSAARLAAGLHADLIAVYIETPALQKLTNAQRDMIHKTLKLAQELGAETTTLSGDRLAPVLLSYAQSRNVSKLVIGKSTRPTWQRVLRTSLADELASRSTDVDVYVVGHDFEIEPDTTARPRNDPFATTFPGNRPAERASYLWAALICIGLTGLSAGLVNIFDLANVIMVYLLATVLIAIRFGRGPSIFASFLSVASFDFFFVPPRFSFSVSDTQYLFTFAIMLAVSLIISNLTASLRFQARIASLRERRSNALTAMSKALSSALMVNQIIEISNEHLVGAFQSRIAILLPDSHEAIRQPLTDTDTVPEELDLGVAQWVYDNQQRAGLGTNTLPANPVLYIPLQAPMRTRGVLAIAPLQARTIFQPEQQRLLDTFASQIALALERIHYVEVAQDALISMEAERLRNSLLSAISHDLRTPLTAIVGLASTLQTNVDPATRDELVQGINEEARHMSSLIVNLLDMAKLQSGKVVLNRQWQPIDEVIGSALRISAPLTAHMQITLRIADRLPLVQFDAVLIERVLCNLIENAVKYGRDQITIEARLDNGEFELSVADNGRGLPDGLGDRIFDKFTRGEQETSTHGVGLGLAICKAIVEAHHGTIHAANMPGQGAKISIRLPLGTPPSIEQEP